MTRSPKRGFPPELGGGPQTYQSYRAKLRHAPKRAAMIAAEGGMQASADEIIDDLPDPAQEARLRQMYPSLFETQGEDQ